MHRTIQRYLHAVLAAVVAYIAMIVTAAASPVNFVSAGKISVFLDKTSATPSRDEAATTCKNKGGILLADYTPAVQQMYMEPFVNAGANYLCQSTSSGWDRNCYGAYTEGQATETDKCSVTRRETMQSLAFDPTAKANICPYRWSLGWFGRYTNDLGQVGVNFYDSAWADLAFDGSDPSQVRTADYMRNYERMVGDTSSENIYAGGPANDYDDGVMWNASYQCFTKPMATTMAACIPPHGNPFIALGARQLSGASGGYYGVRVDVANTPDDSQATPNSPFVPNNYVVACQWQGVEASYYASTTLPPQPPMVPDWKEPTWMQSHWWIIYLVVAVVLLALLVAFIVWYECKLCAARSAADDDDTEADMEMSSSSDVASDVTPLRGTEKVAGVKAAPPAVVANKHSVAKTVRRVIKTVPAGKPLHATEEHYGSTPRTTRPSADTTEEASVFADAPDAAGGATATNPLVAPPRAHQPAAVPFPYEYSPPPPNPNDPNVRDSQLCGMGLRFRRAMQEDAAKAEAAAREEEAARAARERTEANEHGAHTDEEDHSPNKDPPNPPNRRET